MTAVNQAYISARYPLKKDLLALFTNHSTLTNQEASALLSYRPSSICRTMRDLKDSGKLVIAWEEKAGNGSKKLHYALAGVRQYARIGATEYRGWQPTGTDTRTQSKQDRHE